MSESVSITAWKKPPNSPEGIFVCASGYHQAARLIRNTMLLQKNFSFMFPWTMNAAFCIELYLKCLAWLETGKYNNREHKLWELFCCLPKNTQDSLALAYQMDVDQDPVRQTLKAQKGKPIDLVSELKASTSAFVIVRYAFEDTPDATSFGVGPLADRLREKILSLRPEWRKQMNGLSLPPDKAP